MAKQAYHIHVEMPVDWRFGREILSGLLEARRAAGWAWGVTCYLWQQEEVWTLQKNQSPDVVVGSFYQPSRVQRWLNRHLVLINIAGCETEPPGVHTVTVDNLEVGRHAAEHFLERGYRRFAYVCHVDSPASRQRRRGFLEAIGEIGPVAEHGELKPETMTAFLQALPPATGIFCHADNVARYVAILLDQLNRAVPEEYAILGVNDDPLDNGLSPTPLSSIDIRPEQIGREAARTIHRLLSGQTAPVRQLLPPGPLITRSSTDILAMDDPILVRILSRIRERACEQIRVQDILHPSDGSRRAIEIRFKKYLGRTIEEEIRRCRLLAARDLLLNTTMTIHQIADACGYSNPPHFSRAFKAVYHTSPGAYRK